MRAYRIVDGKYCVTGSSIRFQENANRKVVDYKIIEFQKFLRPLTPIIF